MRAPCVIPRLWNLTTTTSNVMLRYAQHLAAQRERPFAEFTLERSEGLRVTREWYQSCSLKLIIEGARFIVGVYRAQFKTSFLMYLQYRASSVLWLLGMVLEPVIYLVVWSTITRANGGVVATLDKSGGYRVGDFAAYFLVLLLVNHLTDNWVFYEFEGRVRQGLLSPLLLRPIHPIHADIAQNLTYKWMMLVVMLPTAGVLALVFHPTAHVTPLTLLLFFPSLALAIAIRFLVEWSLGLSAFWTTQMSAVLQVYYVALFFLSGQMGPLTLFPVPVQVLAQVLPFQWMLAFPVQLLLGQLDGHAILVGLAAQAIWLGLSLALMTVLWRRGLRRYSGTGA
jgi:ABC-2 type transport system permease protein